MMFRTYMILVLTVCIVAFSIHSTDARSMPGGWASVENANDDENIVASARFATDAKYVNENASIRIVECHRQVVAGLKYDMKVEVTNGSNVCKVEHYEVWDRFGEKRVITSETLTSESCAN